MNEKDKKKNKINSTAEVDYSYMTEPVKLSPEILKFANKDFSDEEIEQMKELMDKINEIGLEKQG